MDLRLDYAAIGMRIRTLRHRQGSWRLLWKTARPHNCP